MITSSQKASMGKPQDIPVVKPARKYMPSKKTREDELVMGTNNSSITSKRSVERIYYPEPHFFRHFVKKPQRRSPLINRGYWLRMHAVDQIVDQFLSQTSQKRKVIINLGCGYDPLPFQWLSRKPQACKTTTFVDIDHPALIARKIEMVRAAPDLCDLIGWTPHTDIGSSTYRPLGSDLSNIEHLDTLLRSNFDLSKCAILCVAEVSITYMSVATADGVIAWAGRQSDLRFCLLEQCMPAGAQHPFARKMQAHFRNLNTLLKCVETYPRLQDQHARFSARGYKDINLRTLWDVWRDEEFTPTKLRQALDRTEPFDEWEEFILFASHYFLLVACTPDAMDESASESTNTLPIDSHIVNTQLMRPSSQTVDLQQTETYPAHRTDIVIEIRKVHHIPLKLPSTRFAAQYNDASYIALFGGLGTQRRTNSTILLQRSLKRSASNIPAASLTHTAESVESYPLPCLARVPTQVDARMCHTISRCKNTILLVGGRTSPDNAMRDCWSLEVNDESLPYTSGVKSAHDVKTNQWRREPDVPVGLYRHGAVAVDFGHVQGHGILVYGGKTGSEISRSWFLWCQGAWRTLKVKGFQGDGVFGATMVCVGDTEGWVLGGMTAEGVISRKALWWRLNWDEEGECVVDVESRSLRDPGNSLFRFGAQARWSINSGIVVVGGLSDELVQDEILVLRNNLETRKRLRLDYGDDTATALLTGHSAVLQDGNVVMLSGGAVCFSFGTVWNCGIYEFHLGEDSQDKGELRLVEESLGIKAIGPPASIKEGAEVIAVPSHDFGTARTFAQICRDRSPVVFRQMSIGSCLTEWAIDRLVEKIGPEREVSVHVAETERLNFLEKNFSYVVKRFQTFADEIKQGSYQYLRSLSAVNPTKSAAQIEKDFPTLAADLIMPSFLRGQISSETIHSSVLRVAGPIQIWLHYDVMANVLIQVCGRKEVRLFPPASVGEYGLPPGASSSSIDVFTRNEMGGFQTILGPGDILFIPPFWLHATRPAKEGDKISISANIFFRDPDVAYASSGRDVYGNRDLEVYERARREVRKIKDSFSDLPKDISTFYLSRLATEIEMQ